MDYWREFYYINRMEIQLRKPEFIKINQIQPVQHCYHVYCKVVSANHSETVGFNGKAISVVEGVVADETGSANFKLTGQNAKLIETGKVIALRNGRSNIVDEHLILELDQFGRCTEENDVNMKAVNTEKNISAALWERKKKQ